MLRQHHLSSSRSFILWTSCTYNSTPLEYSETYQGLLKYYFWFAQMANWKIDPWDRNISVRQVSNCANRGHFCGDFPTVGAGAGRGVGWTWLGWTRPGGGVADGAISKLSPCCQIWYIGWVSSFEEEPFVKEYKLLPPNITPPKT